jgi:TP901 family phage tail tape measure protein
MATTSIGLTATLDISDFQRNAATYMRTLQEMQATAARSTTSINNSFTSTGSMGNNLVPALDSIGKGFLAIGAAATAAAAGGIAYMASSSIQMASDLEQGLADIAARMRESTDSITPLRDELMRLAISPDLKVSLDDATQASMQLASAGITMEQQLGGALQKTIEFQNAVGGDFGTAANVAIGAMGIFGISSGNMGAAVDGATGAINRSKLSLNDYDYMISNAGTAFAGFGGSLAELNTVAAATAWAFKTGRVQGTGMSMMMNSMAVPTDKAKTAMLNLGLSFWDSQGKAKNLYTIVDELRAKLSGLSKEEQRTTLSDIFGRGGGGTAMGALIQKTGAELQALELEVNKTGQAAQAAETRMGTLQSQFGAFKDIVGTTAISIGSMFTPILRNAFISINSALNPLVKAFDGFGLSGVANTLKLSDSMVQMATTVDNAFKNFYTTLTTGGLMAALSEMGINSDYLAHSFYALTGAAMGLLVLGTAAAGVFLLGAAMVALASPITWLIAGSAALGAAWNTNFMGIRDITYSVMTGIYGRITTTLSQLATITQTYISRWVDLFSKGANAIYNGLSAVFYALPTPVQNAMKKVYEVVTSTMNSAISYVNSALSSITSAAGGYIPDISLPNLPDLVFPDMAGSGAGLADSISKLFTMPPSVGQSFDVGSQSVYRFQAATTAATESATTGKLAFADYATDVLSTGSAAKSAGKSVEQMAEDISKAKEKISDNNLSMANLRGEIAQLESQYPGLTKEVTDNFNAHIAAGNSVASFGDKLGATERRQMFNYLTKLIDMNNANKELAGSNGLIDKSFGAVKDGFMEMVDTMSAGINIPTTFNINGNQFDYSKLDVVGSLLPPEQAAPPDTATASQGMMEQSTAMTAASTAATTLNPLLTTMAGIYNDSLNPALLLASTYLPIISQSWIAINDTLAALTTTPLPLLASLINETINPALLAMGIQVDILSNTSLAGMSNMVLSQVMPALGQLYTSLSTQVAPALIGTGVQSDLLVAAYERLIEAGGRVIEASGKIIEAFKKEDEAITRMIKFYEQLKRAKEEAAMAGGPAVVSPDNPSAGFAGGGSFVVPSGYPSHGSGMPIRVHSGELVKVFTAAQTRQMSRSHGNQRIISNSSSTTNNSNRVVNFNITTQQPSKSILSDLAFAKAKYGVF